ncbi:hypothetical protein [Glutamicibacter sp. BW78]|uniref:hypothetical protein n=1 Tax=Glutamicibacter sp. BW78 TaxID=2024403 RepID=UPI00117AE003|nr:hypothetical protein [Glutamicibacter sp. BW78]
MAKKTNGPRISFSDVLANSLFLRAPERIREVAAETAATRQADAARVTHGDEFVAKQAEDAAQKQDSYQALAVAMKRESRRRVAERQASNQAFATAQREALPKFLDSQGKEIEDLSKFLDSQGKESREGMTSSSKSAMPRWGERTLQEHRASTTSLSLDMRQMRGVIAGTVVAAPGSMRHKLPALPEKAEGFGGVEFSNPSELIEVIPVPPRAGPAATVKESSMSVNVQEEGQPVPGTWARALREAVLALAAEPGLEKIVVGEPVEPGGTPPIEIYFRDSNTPTDPTSAR